jgi:hypothetical protein
MMTHTRGIKLAAIFWSISLASGVVLLSSCRHDENPSSDIQSNQRGSAVMQSTKRAAIIVPSKPVTPANNANAEPVNPSPANP